MKYSIIQRIMLEKILDDSNSTKLEDFYDVFSFDLIEDELERRLGKNYNREEHKITVVDVARVANHLINTNHLSDEEIHNFILYLNDNYKPSLMDNNEFIYAYDNIRQSLNYEISYLSNEIKKNQNQEKVDEELNYLNGRRELVDKKSTKLAANKTFIKLSMKELELLKLKLPLNFSKPKNKKELLLKKHNKLDNEKQVLEEDDNIINLHRAFSNLSLLIDNNEISEEELQNYVINLISNNDIKDSRMRKDIVTSLKKLSDRLKQLNKEHESVNKEKSNIIRRIDELKNIEVIDDEVLKEYIARRNYLKTLFSLLDSITKDSELSSKGLREAINSGRRGQQQKNLSEALNDVIDNNTKKGYVDVEMHDKDFSYRLGSYTDQQPFILSGFIEHELMNYKPEGAYYDAFYLKQKNGRTINHNYVFSIENHEDDTIVRMHVLNLYPMVPEPVLGYWTENFYKRFDDNYQMDQSLDNYINAVCAFKNNSVYPTIAYTFHFNKNYKITDFNIEKRDVKIRSITLDDSTVINNIYDINNDSYAYNRADAFFERLLKKKFVEYATKNNLPVIYYGMYNDQTNSKYKEGVDIGSAEMGDKILQLDEMLAGVSRKDFNNVTFKWFKNFRMKHFSLEYNDDFIYMMDDLGLINPASFLGNNLQKVINTIIFEKKYNNYNSENFTLRENQKKNVEMFNKICGYIELDDFLKMVSETINPNDKRKGSK